MKSAWVSRKQLLAFPPVVCLALLALLAVTGCKKSSGGGAALDPKVFASASAETKTLWEEALAARQTNGFVEAYIKFRLVRGQAGLTPDQIAAADAQCRRINEELGAAAAKGDATAQQALVDIRNASRMRAR